MAFGFFKKQETADLILMNGHIYTQDPQLPWTEAVACKGDTIIGVGHFEEMDALVSSKTQVINLDGKYVFPGFIDAHRSPVLRVFEDKYLDLSSCTSAEEIAGMVEDYADDNPDLEVIFGFGYREELKPEGDDDFELEEGAEIDQAAAEKIFPGAIMLQKACEDRPVLLLSQNCIDLWTNLTADRIIAETAEEEFVQIITTGYVLNLLLPFDFEEIEADVKKEMENLADKGITSVLTLSTPDYFQSLYQDALVGLYNESDLQQRFFGSFYANRPLVPASVAHKLMTNRTRCLEMGDMMKGDVFHLQIANADSPIPFSQEALNTILAEASDRSFIVFLEAEDHDDLLMAYNALEFVRSKGYKNTFILASDEDVEEDEVKDMMYWEECFTTWATDPTNEHSVFDDVDNVQDAVDQLTVVPAAMLNMEEKLGTIARGKLADFTIFEENPLEMDLKRFAEMPAEMTIVGGQIVYDANVAADMELYNMMAAQHL